MRSVAVLLVPLFLYGAATSALTVDDLSADAEYTITALHIEGASRAVRSAIRGAILSTPPPWYKPWKRWLAPVMFNPELLRTDLDRVKTVLRESGYYEARVTHDVLPADGTIEITLHVEAGAPALVAQVDLVAADFALAPDREQALRAQVSLKPGDVFTQQAYDAARNRIERSYLERGFAYAEVTKAAVVDTATHEARVTYTIARGVPAVFGQTTIEGHDRLPEVLIRRELMYEPGEPYDPRRIEKTQANIFGLSLFRSVAVEPSNLDDQRGTVEIATRVVEGPARSINLGIGYGLEDELRAQVQWQHNNLFGGGRRLGVRLKASFITQSIEGEFRQPYFLHPKQTLVVPLTQVREEEPGFSVIQMRLAPRLERRLGRDVTASIGYNIERDELSDVPAETKRRLEEFRGRGFVSSLTGSIERNTVSDLLDPHDGSVLTLAVEQAGGPWRGDFTFYRGLFEAKTYLPAVWRGQVFAARFRLGAGDGFGQSRDLPMFRRFFAGGINSTRGYDRSRLGPLTAGEDPIGGRSLIEGNVELRMPVYGGIGAVVFLDAARVDERAFRYDLGRLQYGAGPGVRYNTPVGPLRLDIGFPLNAPAGLPSWQLHFSIGQAF